MPKSLAIDVVLLPPEDVMAKCRELNARLWEETKQGFRFDDTHLPHITLVQQYIRSADQPAVMTAITSIANNTRPITFDITKISAETFEGLNIFGFELSNPANFQRLQNILLAKLEPFVATGDENGWYRDSGESIRTGSLKWVDEFRTKSSHHPHMTLGVGPTPVLNEPFSFTASRLAVCHLGNFNTCRKILQEWRLQ
ncbi:MAG: 2'-5' RNA ligase family protein [Candidatus Kerfeldbacteria bacterium]|nr:2'-5' RNA ligase family protein [Candidatus Kerfeldbacteria bacterium]